MTTPLLTTKLYVPSVRPDPATGFGMRLVSRPRLIERLNAGLYRSLTLISSPAGFGKTTLLSKWAAECGRPVAWLSLDEGDNDPARFWAYFVAALQTVDTTIGRGVPGAFQAAPPMLMETFLTALINDISAVPDRFALVLDDYHLITAQPIHDGIAFLLDHLPPNLHLAIATRADPPLPVARLRGQGQLTELRQSDLRFTVKEAAAFLNDVMGLDLSTEDVAALEARTEGWIAGLQMASLALQAHLPQARGPHETAAFIRAFTGSDRYVLDYLVEQVLQRQPEHVQTFLLQTSMLDRLTGPLCDAVLQIGGPADQRAGASLVDSQGVLEYLERNNLFVVPLDNERRWYRYHHLFADLLRYRLGRVYPELIPVLHGRAGAWYEERGLVAEAIDHALAAGDPGWAAHLVEQAAESTMLRSEFATLLRWVEALPEDHVRALPRLCVYQALALVFNGQPLDLAQSCLQRAVEADADGAVAGEVTAFRALIAAYRGERERSAELSRQALDLLPEASLFFRSFVAGFLGLAHLYIGDMETATRAFEEAVRVSEKMGNLTIAVLARCHLAELAMLQGRVREAERFYEQALEAVVDEQGRWPSVAGVALTGLGRIALERYNLAAAERYLTEGIELAERWSVAGAISGYIDLARARQVQGDGRGALEAIQTAQRLAERFDALEIDDISVALCQARLWVAQGNLEAAARWIEERGLDQDLDLEVLNEEIRDGSSLYRLVEYATVALVRIAQDRPVDALRVLRPLLGAAEDAGWVAYCIEVLALEALALQAQGNDAQALAALERALTLAEPGSFVRMFVERGPPMARLLYQAAAGEIAPQFAGRLLVAFPALEAPAPARGAAAEMVEPLSDRELEVLRLIAEGLSNQEIAQRLFISLRTVKWHSSNIYGKLGVRNRTQAVARARSLGLLPTV